MITTIILLYILSKMEKVTLTIKEIWEAMKKQISKNRKKYTRKTKHKKDYGKEI